MPTAIAVTSPDLALPSPEPSAWLGQGAAPLDRQTPAAVVLRAPHQQPLDEALTETSAVLEHHGHLIVLYSAACPPEHVRRLHTLRAVLESDRIAILPSALPPLGVAVLARQLRQLSVCGFSPGVLACAARLLAHYVHAGALLGSVTGLDRVEVDLRSHMKSWLPGAHFAVLATPQPQLLHVDRHSTDAGLRPPGFATQLAVARGQLTADWVTSALAPAWQVQGVYEAHLPTESARWWGTQKLIEFAAAIPDPALLSRLVASVRREECGWCGQEVIGDRCAFCAAPLARDRAGGGSAGREPAAIAGAPAALAATAPAPGAPPPPAAPVPDPSGCSPLRQRGLSPVAPAGVPGVVGISGVPGPDGAPQVPGPPQITGVPPTTGAPHGTGVRYGPGVPGVRGGPGHLDVRGPDVMAGAVQRPTAPPPGPRGLTGDPDHPDLRTLPGGARRVAHVR
ncbi:MULTISPECIES: hypothetical protein [Streptomyces]|uniref:Uncharacterized protein n=2 Tax=Streptomyces TaxID=1883 RepID=A0A2N8PDT2_STRNR|nr:MULTISPECIES: hypothetical protein [Streptomyces]PNE39195.1 hypothetical protein AOB60_35385 [Streptomyces noursei]SHL28018.1 hypothetical protein SAMN05216268_103455 [Streptomyces yunnanensis]